MSTISKIKVPLFWKFSIIATLVVLVFGTTNIFLLWNSVYHSFEKEIDKRCTVLASMVAEKSFSPIVYDDLVSLYAVLDETLKSDPSIAYLFLMSSDGKVIAHVPEINIPRKLLSINTPKGNQYQIKVIEATNFDFKTIRDIAYPISNGEIGIVRMGIGEENIRTELNNATQKLLFMIGFFLILGLGGAFFFSYIITSPIKAINKKAQHINLNTIANEDFNIEVPQYKKMVNFYFSDELDVLVSKFNLMMNRLKDNVTELRKTRDSFVQTEKLASIGTLTSGIGHEINNPLSGIKICINRIAKNPQNLEQNIGYIEMIGEAIDKIESVVQQLLNFSRKQDIKYEKINPVEIIDNSIGLAAYKLEKNDVTVDHAICCVQYIRASTNHLSQVFLNLFLNAIDAIEEKKQENPELEGKINVAIECKDNHSYIQFSDNGKGIKPEIINQIFDPFFTSKEVGKGTGLGLYVSFEIIREHGGKLTVSSEYGEGTTFTIALPLESTEEIIEDNDLEE